MAELTDIRETVRDKLRGRGQRRGSGSYAEARALEAEAGCCGADGRELQPGRRRQACSARRCTTQMQPRGTPDAAQSTRHWAAASRPPSRNFVRARLSSTSAPAPAPTC